MSRAICVVVSQLEVRRFCKECTRSQQDKPLSFVAKSKSKPNADTNPKHEEEEEEEEGKILAFSINCEVEHYRPGEAPGDRLIQRVGLGCAGRLFCVMGCWNAARGRMCSTGAPMPPAYHQHNVLYSDLFQSWSDWSRRQFSENQCLHMVYSGATSDSSIASGAAAVRACDEAALQSATELGFEIAYTVCTSDVTHFIASEELHFKKRLQVQWKPESGEVMSSNAAALPPDHRIVLYDKLLQQPSALQELRFVVYTASELQTSGPNAAEQYAQLQQCVEQAFHSVPPVTLRREMRHLHSATNDAIMLCANDGSVVGGATLGMTMHSNGDHHLAAAELMLVAVSSEYSGRGFAGRLLEAADRLGAACGLRQLFLVTKPVARGFYERHGYRSPSLDEQVAYEQHKVKDQLESEVIHDWHYEVLTLVKDLPAAAGADAAGAAAAAAGVVPLPPVAEVSSALACMRNVRNDAT